ncbi:MAG: hypothetical protein ACD_73C00038G0005 [uncultured bacterium]|nr:MAG: hypothetical protein ACD_73C00038G0005 [uncultured bacterium]
MSFDVLKIREDFPILKTRVYGKPLVYLDNAASTQKPKMMVDRISEFYLSQYANVHRGVHFLSQEATEHYEKARRNTICSFIGGVAEQEVIFTRGATESINLVAASFGEKFVGVGDEIIISGMEHHSNIVPWQMLCEKKGASLKVIPILDNGELDIQAYQNLLTEKVKLVSVVHISNALGTINPVSEMIKLAHEKGIPVLLDGAQAIPHEKVDVKELDCDFYVFSGHKIFGPTGVGILYGKEKWLGLMPPYQGGGDMIRSVTFEKTIYNDLPYKFEAGTPHIEGAIGLAAVIDYLNELDWAAVKSHEASLLEHATRELSALNDVRLIGTAPRKASVVSFVLEGIHPHDIGTILDSEGIAIRVGHHCAQPVMERFGVPATARASFAFYNTHEEVEKLVEGVKKVIHFFK